MTEKTSQLPSDCGNYPDGWPRFEDTVNTKEKADAFMTLLRAHNPVQLKLLHGYCSYTYSTLFLDQDKKYITDIHENDAEWREEYFRCITGHFGILTESIENLDDALESFSEQLENEEISLSEIDYTKIELKS